MDITVISLLKQPLFTKLRKPSDMASKWLQPLKKTERSGYIDCTQAGIYFIPAAVDTFGQWNAGFRRPRQLDMRVSVTARSRKRKQDLPEAVHYVSKRKPVPFFAIFSGKCLCKTCALSTDFNKNSVKPPKTIPYSHFLAGGSAMELCDYNTHGTGTKPCKFHRI